MTTNDKTQVKIQMGRVYWLKDLERLVTLARAMGAGDMADVNLNAGFFQSKVEVKWKKQIG